MRDSVRIRLVFTVVTLALGAGAIGAGCTVKTNDAGPSGAGAFQGRGDAGTSTCTSCVAQECTGVWAACFTDSDCRAIHACAKGGDPASCVCGASAGAAEADAAADASAADPRALYRAFAACTNARTAACSAECGGTASSTSAPPCADEDAGAGEALDASDPDASPGPVGASVESCRSCAASKCGDAKKSCALGTECAAYLACVHAAADDGAAGNCLRQHATGEVTAAEFATCMRVGCSEACGF